MAGPIHESSAHPTPQTWIHTWVSAAISRLEARHEYINAVNVFPVADADTAHNMLATLSAGLEALELDTAQTAPLTTLARGAMLGAAGNSGLILAAWLAGFATAGAGLSEFNESNESLALNLAQHTAQHTAQHSVNTSAQNTARHTAPNLTQLLDAALTQAAAQARSVVAAPAPHTMLDVAAAVRAHDLDTSTWQSIAAITAAQTTPDAGAWALACVITALGEALGLPQGRAAADAEVALMAAAAVRLGHVGTGPAVRQTHPAAARPEPTAAIEIVTTLVCATPGTRARNDLEQRTQAFMREHAGDSLVVTALADVLAVHVHFESTAAATPYRELITAFAAAHSATVVAYRVSSLSDETNDEFTGETSGA